MTEERKPFVLHFRAKDVVKEGDWVSVKIDDPEGFLLGLMNFMASGKCIALTKKEADE